MVQTFTVTNAECEHRRAKAWNYESQSDSAIVFGVGST
jgi:hypothetical protein